MNNKGYETVKAALDERLGERTYATTSQHFDEEDGYSSRYVSFSAHLGPGETTHNGVDPVRILSALHDAGLMASHETRVVHSDTPQFAYLGVFTDLPHNEGETPPPKVMLEDLNA